MAVKQGFLMYYTKGDAIGTKVSVRYRESGRLSGVVVKRGFTVHACMSFMYRTTDIRREVFVGCRLTAEFT